MGHLLSAGIKMQGGAPATATIEINNFDGVVVSWYKNSVYQGDVLSTLSTTVNAGDTFYVVASDSLGCTVYYSLNGSLVTFYSDTTVTTPTLTAAGGNTYKYDVYAGF